MNRTANVTQLLYFQSDTNGFSPGTYVIPWASHEHFVFSHGISYLHYKVFEKNIAPIFSDAFALKIMQISYDVIIYSIYFLGCC